MPTNIFRSGSQWKIWDLHVHTPFSYLNTSFPTNFDEYVKLLFTKALENNVAAIGITDYFTIDGYKKIKNDYLDNTRKLKELFNENQVESISRILILPNIEFRVKPLINKSRINFHVIFSNEVTIQDIEENFLHELNFEYQGRPQDSSEKWKLKLNNLENLGRTLKTQHDSFKTYSDINVGMMNAVVDDEEIIETLIQKPSKFKNKYLVVIPSDEDLSRLNWDGQHHQTRKVLLQKADMIYSSNPNTIKWSTGRLDLSPEEYINEFKSLKPCIWGSDAHSPDELFTKNKNRLLWIKADTTFEGLKQLLYEPVERVMIQESSPDNDFPKPFISNIKCQKRIKLFEDDLLSFSEFKLPLNRNLVSIIGGRGTGKSILVNYLANGFNQFSKQDFLLNKFFKVSYNKSLEELIEFEFLTKNDLEFIFISQSEVKEKVENPKALSLEIKKTLGIEGLSYDNLIDELVDNYQFNKLKITNWFERTDEQGNKVNNLDYINSQKRRYSNLLRQLTTEDNKTKLKSYGDNIETIKKNNLKIERLNSLVEKLRSFESEINEEIRSLDPSIPQIEFFGQYFSADKLKERLQKENKLKIENNENIKNDFQYFKGDLSTLLDNVGKYRAQIKTLDERLKEYENYKKRALNLFNSKKEIIDKIKIDLLRQQKIINDSWTNTLKGKPDWTTEQVLLIKDIVENRGIKIEGNIVFDKHVFYDMAKNFIDGRVFKRKGDPNILEGFFQINDYNSFFSKAADAFYSLKENNPNTFVEYENHDIEDLVLNSDLRSKYLYVHPKITYENKTLDKLSIGQRGTIYLCLKLATSTFSQPIVYDQPEDDLDNQFIINELVDIFKKLKNYRQVIIITHNANLVINSDSEQIVIAENNEEVLSYNSGSLENPNIIDLVCKILEGGKKAFEKRKLKYQIIEYI